jgi:hypothetical protein
MNLITWTIIFIVLCSSVNAIELHETLKIKGIGNITNEYIGNNISIINNTSIIEIYIYNNHSIWEVE